MENELFKLASSQGIWAALSVGLIFYILKAQERRDLKQEKREENYQNIISSLSVKLDTMHEIKKDVKDVKNAVISELR